MPLKAADILLQTAIAAGAPKDILSWIDEPLVKLSNQLMHHLDINLILATSGPSMAKARTVPFTSHRRRRR